MQDIATSVTNLRHTISEPPFPSREMDTPPSPVGEDEERERVTGPPQQKTEPPGDGEAFCPAASLFADEASSCLTGSASQEEGGQPHSWSWEGPQQARTFTAGCCKAS